MLRLPVLHRPPYLEGMSKPETDPEFRGRIRRVAAESDWFAITTARSHALDEIGRKYDRFRYGSSLQVATPPIKESDCDWTGLMPSNGKAK